MAGKPRLEVEEPTPIGQVLLDDLFLLFLIGISIPFFVFTIWGLIDISSIPVSPR